MDFFETSSPGHQESGAACHKAILSPLLVNERDAAKALGGLCQKTLFNLRKAGKLRGVRIGSRILYAVEDLQAFVESSKIINEINREDISPHSEK